MKIYFLSNIHQQIYKSTDPIFENEDFISDHDLLQGDVTPQNNEGHLDWNTFLR